MNRFAYAKKYLHVYLITIIVIKKHVNNTNVHDKKQLGAIYCQYYDRPTTKASKFNIHKRS